MEQRKKKVAVTLAEEDVLRHCTRINTEVSLSALASSVGCSNCSFKSRSVPFINALTVEKKKANEKKRVTLAVDVRVLWHITHAFGRFLRGRSDDLTVVVVVDH